MRAHTKQFVTMNVYRAECVTELGPNRSEPEASVGRTYALTGHKSLNISKTKAHIETFSGVKCFIFDFPQENIKKSKNFFFVENFSKFFSSPQL